MIYIFAAIAALIILFLIGHFTKRRYFNEVDRYETWKIDIMNRPVLDEMSKVKQLNMTGQTEELFEGWRSQWDEIVTVELPSIEEDLFDAEDFTDKFRFGKAKMSLSRIDAKLAEIEERIKTILNELNELVGSEEKNREEIEGLREMYRKSRKTLLAHSHSFGSAEKLLEEELNSLNQKFLEFDEKTESGDYLVAREIVLSIDARLKELEAKLETIPQLLLECHTGIPSQLSELKDGCKEMAEKGYILDHLGMEKEIAQAEEALESIKEGNIATDTFAAKDTIDSIKEKIDHSFNLLENEVEARQYISQVQPITGQMLAEAAGESEKILEELESVRQSYHLSDKELARHSEAENRLEELMRKYLVIEARIQAGEAAFTYLKEELDALKAEVEDCTSEQKELKEKLSALRKDEMEARENVKELTRKVNHMIRIVSKSNLPGLSQNYKYLLDDAKESIQNVAEQLEKKPLDIPVVNQHLEIAVLTVDKLEKTTIETVENVQLTERLIQYGNRYRTRYPSVAEGLKKAEYSFRNYDYREALEQAASAIEEVEPGALKKLDEIFLEKQN